MQQSHGLLAIAKLFVKAGFVLSAYIKLLNYETAMFKSACFDSMHFMFALHNLHSYMYLVEFVLYWRPVYLLFSNIGIGAMTLPILRCSVELRTHQCCRYPISNVWIGQTLLVMFLLFSCNRPSTRCLARRWKCPMTRLRLKSEQTKSFARWIWMPTTGCHWRSLSTVQWTTRQLFSCCSVSRVVQRRTANQRCGQPLNLVHFHVDCLLFIFLDFRPASWHCFNWQIYAENYFDFRRYVGCACVYFKTSWIACNSALLGFNFISLSCFAISVCKKYVVAVVFVPLLPSVAIYWIVLWW